MIANSSNFTNLFLMPFTELMFGIYVTAVLLRVMFQYLRVDFFNPISQIVVKVTNPPLIPMRRIIPGFFGIDFASIVLLLALSLSQSAILFSMMNISLFANFHVLIIKSIFFLFSKVIDIFTFALIGSALLSWFAPHSNHPIAAIFHNLTAPLLNPIRRIIPPTGGIDFSSFALLILLQFSKRLLVWLILLILGSNAYAL